MPFQSQKQRRYMHANLPDIANRWEAKYGLGGIAELNSQLNSLPEYYLPKNQGGLIPAHEAGIYGLNEGGRIGFFTGMREAEQEQKEEAHHGDVAHGPGGRFDQPSAPTTTTREVPPGEKGGPGYVSPEDLQTLKIKDFVNKQEEDWGKYDNPLDKYSYNLQGTKKRRTFLEKQALDNWNAVKDTANTWAKKKAGKAVFDHFLLGGATFGLGDVIGGLVQGFKTNKAKQEFIDVIKGSIAEYQKLGIPEHSPHTDTLIQTLNQQLLDLTQTRDRPDEDTGGDGITGIASITYDDMEGYNEKVRASTEWSQEQKKVDRSKQDAYYAAFRQKYLMGDTEESQLMPVAQGGRIPGYNTGGLSNLFRLKNV